MHQLTCNEALRKDNNKPISLLKCDNFFLKKTNFFLQNRQSERKEATWGRTYSFAFYRSAFT